jgi:hypothetical protein
MFTLTVYEYVMIAYKQLKITHSTIFFSAFYFSAFFVKKG